MLTDAAAIDALVHRLQLHHLANPERAGAVRAADRLGRCRHRAAPDRRRAARAGGAAASRRSTRATRRPARHGAAPRFIVLHRERRFSETEQRWIGWERKRGKLEQLVAALADGRGRRRSSTWARPRASPPTRATSSRSTATRSCRPGRLRELVGVAAHPHNQPRLDAARAPRRRRLRHPAAAHRHAAAGAARLHAASTGCSPASAASTPTAPPAPRSTRTCSAKAASPARACSTCRRCTRCWRGRLPEGQVLSHDLLEGSLARCAAVTDITLIEDAPFHADVAASRVHRWTRGDWQLLPFLLQPGRYRLRADQPLEDVRQPAPLAGGADVAGAAAAGAGRRRRRRRGRRWRWCWRPSRPGR